MLKIFKHKPGKLCIVFMKAYINQPHIMTYTFSEKKWNEYTIANMLIAKLWAIYDILQDFNTHVNESI